MGIVDLKFAPDAELVWFEINPQGQFLFVQGLTDLDLASAFTDFLYKEATAASTRLEGARRDLDEFSCGTELSNNP